MNKLLLDERPLLVLPQLAYSIGLNEAIFMQQLHYWLLSSTKVHDDKKWIYNSCEQWKQQFPFWSGDTIRRIIKKLESKDLIICANFNKLAFDRTKWHTINYEKLQESTVRRNRQIDIGNLHRPIPKITNYINNNIINMKADKKHPLLQPFFKLCFKTWNHKVEGIKTTVHDYEKSTKTNKIIKHYLHELLTGQFGVTKTINSAFLKRNNIPMEFANKEFSKKEIVKGIVNVKLLFDKKYWPPEKTNLSKSLKELMFNARSGSSLFLKTLHSPPKKLMSQESENYRSQIECLKKEFELDGELDINKLEFGLATIEKFIDCIPSVTRKESIRINRDFKDLDSTLRNFICWLNDRGDYYVFPGRTKEETITGIINARSKSFGRWISELEEDLCGYTLR